MKTESEFPASDSPTLPPRRLISVTRKSATFLLLLALGALMEGQPAAADSLEAGFHHPPNSARPQTWWHWMNGNITKVGLKLDLEAMKQIGLGGATIVNVDCGIPPGPVPFMSPQWREDFKYAVQVANRLGLKLCVENCAGWSSSGGPWNTPEHAMQRVTTSEVHVTGPRHFSAPLPRPPTKLNFYRDIAVLAFPTPKGGGERIQNIAAKDGRNGGFVLSSPATTNAAPGSVIRREATLDLTSHLQADGRFEWDVPKGQWTILRIGYTPTGVDNHPAPKAGEGLECDKMSKTALDAHWDGFMQKILNDIGPLAGKALDCSLIDSYEVGGQNWTRNFRREFERLRGYDPLKYLPTFTGRVVDNPEVSERFLWDVRRTIADLFAENYFGHFAELCHEHGLLSAVEPYTGPFESMQSGAPADVVMGEFWSGSHGHPSIKLAASIAHTYGKTIVGAESFTAAPGPHTGRWQEYPYMLKPLGDLMFCHGLNRYIFHRYAMQPWTNRWPGMTMGQWGFHFERTETWWRQGKPWIDYITHCEYLLQQGHAVADAAYFTGQSAPVEMRAGNPPLPAGYDFDAIDADVLQHDAKVKNGRITLPDGASYAVLILPPNDRNMTPDMLECIRNLVRAGATVLGPRPQHSPSLDDYPQCDVEVKKLADELWGPCDGTTVREHGYGRGRIIWGESLTNVFQAQDLKPDFEYKGLTGYSKLAYAHRVADTADIYFVSNQRRHFDTADCTFRVSGKVPELWHPDTGVIEPAPVYREQDGRTTVRLTFDPAGSVFVVFRAKPVPADHAVAVSFPGERRQAASIPKLIIRRAIYEAVDHSGGTDVTARVAAMVHNGGLSVQVSNEAMGGDPTYLHVKQLRVEYTLNGKPGQAVVREGDELDLPQDRAVGKPPAFRLAESANGRFEITGERGGACEVTMASGKTLRAKVRDVPPAAKITGPWTLDFPPHWGAPPQVTLNKLISWTDDPHAGVRYFSGTAAYNKDINIPKAMFGDHKRIYLDLGEVKYFAQVFLNGHNLGVLWEPPFRAELTTAARPGRNHLEIRITNLWPNRLIGDQQLPPDCQWNGVRLKAWPKWLLEGKPSPTGRFTFTTWKHYSKDSPLLQSGLLGPVVLRALVVAPVE